MPSPFAGMDPYLEGHLWPDVHQRLATEISRRLGPLLRPRYVARLEVYVVEDESPEAEIGILYPDVEVLTAGNRRSSKGESRGPGTPGPESTPITSPLTIPVLTPVEVRVVAVEVRDAVRNELVASIEILSPVNKREPGSTKYRQRRERIIGAGVHLLEIDLLRRGVRPLAHHPKLPRSPWLVTLMRARAAVIEVWPIEFAGPLPVVPVPLRDPDPDVPLELSPALRAIYEEGAYDLSVDYSRPPPPPPLSPAEEVLAREWSGKTARP